MIDKHHLMTVIKDQSKSKWERGKFLPRLTTEFKRSLNHDLIVVISGIRRCGKSVLLSEIRTRYKKHDFYLNFDDERLVAFDIRDFQILMESFIELYGQQKVVFFDEIQNVSGWERFVRRLHDDGYKVFITGSNARMLSKELGTHLTGRYVQVELYPFSFAEFIRFKSIDVQALHGTEQRAVLHKLLLQYLKTGGMPEFVKTNQREYLKALYEGLIYRDILARNRLINERQIKDMVYFLVSNVGKETTYSSLARMIGVKHTQTVKEYLHMFENAYLIFSVNKYDPSLKKQGYAPKKMYIIDNALAAQLGFNFSENRGRMLENLIFVALKRKGEEIFYYKGTKECDFVVRKGLRIVSAIQVSVSLRDSITREREVRGLCEAADRFGLKEATIITEDTYDRLTVNRMNINMVPAWAWLLEHQ